jgi:hypothetical protein
MRAAAVTGDDAWLAGVRMSVAWFLGDTTPRYRCSTSGPATAATA